MLTAIIPAAGAGSRMGLSINKQFLNIAGQPVLARTLLSLKGLADHYVIVARAGEEGLCRDLASSILHATVVTGGDSRQQSVFAGLEAARGSEMVLIHDGCRPFPPREMTLKLIAVARKQGAAVPVLPVVDTIKEVEGGFVQATLPRRRLRAVQTPQAFLWEIVWQAHVSAREKGIDATDDAALVEAAGHPVATVEGSPENIKITTRRDLTCFEQAVRIGTGYDAHRLEPGRPLVLGGVILPHHLGLAGHSDADVLVHAIIDSLLGASALGDIGRHFPDSDPAYKGISSLELLSRTGEFLAREGFAVVNIDATVIAQKPKLAPYIEKMRQSIAAVLKLGSDSVSIKASTTEGLGWAGREEGIAAQAVCSVICMRGRRNT